MVARAVNPILRVNGENGLVASDGTLHERYEYTPYGERTVYKRAGSADEKTSAPLYESQRVEVSSVRQPYGLCDFGHQGLALDKEFGHYHNRSRQYLFRPARFLNRDPAGYVDGMSLYEYCRSSPASLVDPSGRIVPPFTPAGMVGLTEFTAWLADLLTGTSKKCPDPKGPEGVPPEREEPPVDGVPEREDIIKRVRGAYDWRDYVYLGKWEGWKKELGLDLKSIIERAVGENTGFSIGGLGTPGDLSSLPPGYDPGSWKWKPAQNYDPIENPEMRPGNATDPEGNRWQWDPDTSGKHGSRPHWDKDPADGGPRERYLPDGTRLLVERAVEVTTIAVTLKVIWEGTRAIGPFLDRVAGRACPIFIISPMPLEYYAPKPKQPNYFGEQEQPIQG